MGRTEIDGDQVQDESITGDDIKDGSVGHSELNLDDGSNPHATTKADVGLGNADNTSDINKPVSTAQQTALDLKTDKATLTTKGDIYARDASNPTRLGVGAENEVLVSKPTEATGLIWKKQEAKYVDFSDPAGLFNSNITNVSLALDNIRQQRVSQLDARDTDVESFHVLDFEDNTFHAAIGSGSGYYFQLPDATTCLTGQEFELYNGSSNPITVRNNSGTTLVTLNSTDLVRFILEDNSTANGNWLLQVASTTATGIQSYVVSSDTTFTTSSNTDALITGFTVTPVSGRYAIFYSADIVITNNNRTSENVVYVDGVAVENTRRLTQGIGSNYEAAQNSVGEISVDGSEVVDVRVNVDAGSVNVNQRSLVLIRLGGIS